MLINEYVLHHANRLLYFTGTKCNLYHFCAAHQKEVGRARWLTAPKNALFPIEENQISTLFLHFSLHLHLFDKAVCVSSDGKWVDKLRQKRAKQAVSLSINDIICPPDSSACHIGGTRIKEKNKTEGKNVLFFGGGFCTIRAVWMSQSETLGTVCLQMSVEIKTLQCADCSNQLLTPWTKSTAKTVHYSRMHNSRIKCIRRHPF